MTARAKDFKLDKVYQNAYPTSDAFKKCCEFFKAKPKEICFIGDDLPDVCVLKKVGFAVAVKNAAFETKQAAHYVTKNFGGDGAVREVIEVILKAQGKWKAVIKHYC